MNQTELALNLMPEWARDTPRKRAWLRLIGRALEEGTAGDRDSVAARFVTLAPPDALPLLGEERLLRRAPGEYLDAYRNRVANAWTFWDQAGTIPGMLAALEHMGYGVRLSALDGNVAHGIFPERGGGVVLTQAAGSEVQSSVYTLEIDGETFSYPTLTVPDDFRYYSFPPTRVIEHFHENQDIWAEFSLFLTPTNASFNADAWDDGSRWDDGTLWDLTLTQSEVDRVLAVIDEIKPAHARLRGVSLVSEWEQDYWDDKTTWDDGTIWDAATPKPLYLRPGA